MSVLSRLAEEAAISVRYRFINTFWWLSKEGAAHMLPAVVDDVMSSDERGMSADWTQAVQKTTPSAVPSDPAP